MKTITYLLFTFLVFVIQAQNLNELDSARYFDFWAGEWVASWDEGEGVKPLGENTISWNLDDQVLVENFRILEGQNSGFKGTSISVFRPQLNQWKQAWADNNGGYFDFTGAFDGEKRMFQTAIFERGEAKIQQRMVFYDIKEKSMTWDWELSTDGGETWNLNWRIFYTRK